MTHSEEAWREAGRRLAQLRALLDEEQMAVAIDMPIDIATEQLGLIDDTAGSHRDFCTAISRFVQYLYENALPQRLRLTASQAHDEAARLLEHGYGATCSGGYDEAAIDARCPQQLGLRAVLAGMAAVVKAEQREKRRRWAYGLCIESANWETRCAVASLVMAEAGASFEPLLQDCTPEQMVDCIPDLLEGNAANMVMGQQSVSGGRADSPETGSRVLPRKTWQKTPPRAEPAEGRLMKGGTQ